MSLSKKELNFIMSCVKYLKTSITLTTMDYGELRDQVIEIRDSSSNKVKKLYSELMENAE